MTEGALDFLPLWAVFVCTAALTLGSLEVGFRIGRRRASLADPEKESSAGAMAAASLALLAFLLAFTFQFAASRFEARRTIQLDEVNAIGTTWLRARTLPEPERSVARGWLREYVENRIDLVRSGDLDGAIRRSLELQSRLWESAGALAERSPSIMVGLYLQALNQVIDLHTTRVSEALRVRIPGVIWVTLYLLTGLAMLEMGYQTGLSGRRRPLSVLPFALGFAAVILLIADLDRLQEGWLRVSQQPMVELLESMTESPPQ